MRPPSISETSPWVLRASPPGRVVRLTIPDDDRPYDTSKPPGMKLSASIDSAGTIARMPSGWNSSGISKSSIRTLESCGDEPRITTPE